MKKSFVFCILLFSTISCFAQKIRVVNLSNLSAVEAQITSAMDKITIFKDINNKGKYIFAEDTQTKKKYIVGEGKTKEGYNVIFRMEIQVQEVGTAMEIEPSLAGESCTGVNCSKCAFAKGGGCDCEKAGSWQGGPAYCNHNVTKP